MGSGASRAAIDAANETRERIRQHEEWVKHHLAGRDRMMEEQKQREEKFFQEAEKLRKEERERRDKERLEAKERFDAVMTLNKEASDRAQKENEERIKQDRLRYDEAQKRHEEEMTRQREDMHKLQGENKAELEEERRRQAEESKRLWAEMERKEAAAKAEREEIQRKAAEEAERQRKKYEEDQKRAEKESQERLAAQEAEAERKLQEARERARQEKETFEKQQAELQKKYMSGIHPEVWPTAEERRKAEAQMLDPKEDYFHCAIAGLAGSGKSSLINAFRGLRNNLTTAGVAPTGVTETTVNITAYLDPSPGSRFVWYDVPGAGTIKIKGWQYFNSQGLFVFDLIIVVIDNRFSEQDLIILQHCERYKIPSFIVRSKANQHIDNTMRQQLNWEDTDDERDFNEVYLQARDGLVKKTRASVKDNLRRGKLDSNKKVYIVSCDALVSVICDQPKKLRKLNQPIDEVELKETLYEAILARRTWSAEGAQS